MPVFWPEKTITHQQATQRYLHHTDDGVCANDGGNYPSPRGPCRPNRNHSVHVYISNLARAIFN